MPLLSLILSHMASKLRHVNMNYLLALLSLIMVQSIQGQINGGFENWDTVHKHVYHDELLNEHGIANPLGGTPNKWKPMYGVGITRTTDSYTDDFAIILHNWYHYGNEQIMYKDVLSDFPVSISGYYKFIRDNELPDSLLGSAEIVVRNQEKAIIGRAYFEFDTSSNYQYFEMPIVQLSDEQPDSIEIIISNINGFGGCSSPVCNFLYLDDISINFVSNTLDHAMEEYKVYPNPSSGKLILENPNHPSFEIEIYNMHGDLMLSEMSSGEIDIEHLSPGIYILQIVNCKKIKAKRVIKI